MKYVPSLTDKAYVQGMMDAIGLAGSDKIITLDQMQQAREMIAKLPHTHFQSVIGPYCVVCRIDLKGPEYTTWADGQEAL